MSDSTRDRSPPDSLPLKRALATASNARAAESAAVEYDNRLVPPSNLPQKFLNQLMAASVLDGNYNTVETLIESGADPRWINDTSLIRAASLGFTNIVELLHRSGCDIHAQDGMALKCAKASGHAATIQYLRDCGAELPRPSTNRPGM